MRTIAELAQVNEVISISNLAVGFLVRTRRVES
jgi:hypothetical protein